MTLRAEGVSFCYSGSAPLFEDVSFCLHSGEIVGLSGPSGTGKTTFAKVLAGYLEPTSGTITGVEAEGFNPVQMIHQHPEKAVNPRWPLRKVLEHVHGEVDELKHIFGVQDEWLSRRPHEVSGGQLQRLCIARAFDERTRFIIADEITTMLDGITQAEIWREVLRIAHERGIGVLVISHDQALLDHVCTRIVSLEELGFKE